jgi:hypothetical protein
VTVQGTDFDGAASPATKTMDVEPEGVPATMAHRIVGDHSIRALGIPALNDAKGRFTGSLIGFAGGFLRRTLLPEVSDTRGFAGRVVVGHGAASIGLSLRRCKQGDGVGCPALTEDGRGVVAGPVRLYTEPLTPLT